MARMSISVPDELKARMDRIEGENWSETVRPVFIAKVTYHESVEDAMTDKTLERLRLSRDEYLTERETDAKESALSWAKETAEYRELKRIAALSDEPTIEAFLKAIDPNDDLSRAEVENIFGEDIFDEDYLRPFVEEIKSFFEDVDSKL
jgi:hypothetical protein